MDDIRRACLSKKQPFQGKKKVHSIQRTNEDSDDDLFISTLTECNSVDKKSSEIIWITPSINGIPLKMELDTGSAVSVISNKDYKTHFGNIG